jgi:hypothetical protein
MFRMICQGMGLPPAPGTLGLLVQDKHRALARSPTEFHSDWQWWPLVMHSRAVIMDETTPSYRPIVQGIDNVERNHKLALVFEAKEGQGGLVVSCADLPALKASPEARQLWASLLAYVGSKGFAPSQEFSTATVIRILVE